MWRGREGAPPVAAVNKAESKCVPSSLRFFYSPFSLFSYSSLLVILEYQRHDQRCFTTALLYAY